tara:strand:+ start:864 stop:1553 length:690 start_codon:yes stop_codon:yes gene_type:complete
MQVTELITRAWYQSGIVAREFETVSDAETADGLMLLNRLINRSAIEPNLISYQGHLEVSCVPGQEEYSVPGLVDLREMTFNDGEIRFQMKRDTTKRYFGSGRVDNISTLPFHFYFERELNGGKIYLYFLPDKPYLLNITGKVSLTALLISDNLNAYDGWFHDYLTYLLARECCLWRKRPVPVQVNVEIDRYSNLIQSISPADLTINSSPMFKGDSMNYADYNFGRGWRP